MVPEIPGYVNLFSKSKLLSMICFLKHFQNLIKNCSHQLPQQSHHNFLIHLDKKYSRKHISLSHFKGINHQYSKKCKKNKTHNRNNKNKSRNHNNNSSRK